jgi:hypothetical protein
VKKDFLKGDDVVEIFKWRHLGMNFNYFGFLCEKILLSTGMLTTLMTVEGRNVFERGQKNYFYKLQKLIGYVCEMFSKASH